MAAGAVVLVALMGAAEAPATTLTGLPSCVPFVSGRDVCRVPTAENPTFDQNTGAVDIVLADHQHVELFNDPNETPEISISYTLGFSGNFFFDYFLSDENGNEIPGTSDRIEANSTLHPTGVGSFLPLAPGDYPVIFHDIHLVLGIDGPLSDVVVSFYAGEESNVGQWGPVPEPATLALFGFGLGALGVARRRRRPAERSAARSA